VTVTNPAARRILRLGVGTALSLWYSQAMAWPLSFIAPVFTMLLLGLPVPPPGPKQGLVFILALLAPIVAGMSLLPFLTWTHTIGILLSALVLFHVFHFSARGGPPLVGTLLLTGLSIVLAVGSVSIDAIPLLMGATALGAACGLVFVWIPHALWPDPPAPARKPSARELPDVVTARHAAVRAWLVVAPVLVFVLVSPDSAGYLAVMIKVSSMGQQASAGHGRKLGVELLQSTAWGGVGALAGWQLLSLWPSLGWFTLLVLLAGLLYGQGIFRGAGLHPRASMWSYAFLTFLILLVPAVADSLLGSSAGEAFWSRLWLFIGIAVYGSLAVTVVDAFWPRPASMKSVVK